jgi:beta-glucanase (GH16 family)
MKNKFLLVAFLSFCLPSLLIGQRRLDLTNYKMVWNDEFEYSSVNDIFDSPNPKWTPNAPWTNCFSSNGVTYGYYSREDMSLSNGNIILKSKPHTARSCGGATVTQSVSELWSTYDEDYPDALTGAKGFNYGIFEIKAKLPDIDGDYSAFWLWNGYWQSGGNEDSHLSCREELPGWEIDVFEAKKNNGKFDYFSTIQPNGNAVPSCTGCSVWYNFANSNPSNTFHTYTLAWTPTAITWFIDGVEIRTQTTGLVPFKLNLILGVFNWNNNSGGDFVIDYVRLYRPTFTNTTLTDGYLWTDYYDPSRAAYKSAWPSYMTSNGWFNYPTTGNTINANATALINSSINGPKLYYSIGNNLYSARIANDGLTTISGILANNVGGNISADESHSKIYYKSTDNDIYVYYYSSGSWHLGLIDYMNLYPNDVASDVLYVEENSSHPARIYYRDTSNILSYFEYCSTDGQFYLHKTNVNNIKGSLVAAKSPAGKLYYQGTDNHIYNVWKYTSSTASCNSNTVTSWNFGSLDYPYLSANADCAGDIAVSPNGERIYFRDVNDQLSYYTMVSSAFVNTKTGINNVRGKIRINEDDKIYYISTNNKVWNYYKRYLPHSGEEWIAAPLVHTNSNQVLNLLEVTTTSPTQVLYLKETKTYSGNYNLNYFKWASNVGIVNPVCDNDHTSELNNFFKKDLKPQVQSTVSSSIIYPNPNSGAFSLQNPFKYDASFRIFDTRGKIVSYGATIQADSELSLDFPELGNGLYILEISSKDIVKRLKFNIQK